MTLPDSDAIVGLIDVDRLTQTLMDLIALPSVNPFGGPMEDGFGEKAAAEYMIERLDRLGWTTNLQEYDEGRANVLARAPRATGERPAVVFAGHLDTVEVVDYDAPFTGRLAEGRIYGRGACDMKAALACYLELAEVLHALGVEMDGPLAIAGVADEEYRQEGARQISPLLPDTELVVIGEPTEMTVCTAAKGLAAYTLRAEGQATHGSVPEAGRNAILAAAGLAQAVEEHAHDLKVRDHPLLGPPVVNIGVVRGGTKPNVVPPSCELDLSRRLLPGETPESAWSELVDAIGHRSEHDRWSLSPAWWAVEPYENPHDDVVQAFQAAASRQGVLAVDAAGFPASSDAAYFGPPVVIFGPGSLAQAHSLDEWVPVSEMVTATAVYLQFALDRLTGGVRHPEQKDPS